MIWGWYVAASLMMFQLGKKKIPQIKKQKTKHVFQNVLGSNSNLPTR